MEFLVISDTKLKVILTKEDAERMNFSTMDADYDTPEGRRNFRKILDAAREQVGFSSRGDKVLIQFYPSRDGGCEIFVTRLTLNGSAEKLCERYENITVLEEKRTLYVFQDIDTMRRFAAAVRGTLPLSDAYTSNSGACFLDIEENSKKDADGYLYINEFAKKCSQDLRFYVREHFELLYRDNALQRLSDC